MNLTEAFLAALDEELENRMAWALAGTALR